MRLDRSISLGIIRPVQRVWRQLRGFVPASSPLPRAVPILMYHSISDTPEPGVSEYYQVCTSPSRFAEQMAFLADRGWTGVTLAKALAALTDASSASSQRVPAPKLFAITFDDGFRDFQTAAAPILRQHGFSATMYLPTGYIGNQRLTFKARECLTWSEVRELHQAGIEFGSHTVSHPTLVKLCWPEIKAELLDSKSSIERELNSSVTAFGYPYAFPQAQAPFVRQFRALLASLGYESCVTTAIGRARGVSDRLCLPRLPANSADDPNFLEGKLVGAYDWIAIPQSLRKFSQRRSTRRDSLTTLKHAS